MNPHIVGATFVNNEFEPGWLILNGYVRLGSRYKIDLSRVESATVVNADTGQSRPIHVVWVVEPGLGWLPLEAFKVDES